MTTITFIESLLPSVHDTLSLREALSKLAQCERQIKQQGACSIIDNFNIIYSCLCHVKELKSETLDEILNTLIKGMIILEGELKKILSEKQTTEIRVRYLNTVKIFIYLIVEFSSFLEKKQMKDKDSDLMSGSKKVGAKKQAKKNTGLDVSSHDGQDWNDTKEKVLDALAKVLILNIQKLWDPPIAEEQFVISITNLCYKFTENLQSNLLRPQQKKLLKEHLCHILGIMIKKYNHSYGACVMIMQTLPHYDHYSSLYAELIYTCVSQLGYESILPDVLREFRHTNLSSGQSSNAKGNESELKAYSQFLIELADKLSPQLLPYLSLIQDLLDEESYLMRNAIIYIYGEIIIKVLNQETTSNDLKLKEMRNELLDTLLEHIHDINSFTRSKTLQVWRKICEEKAVPLNYMNELMKRCVGRMEDSTSTVRKSAFQLLCDLIRGNPYGIKSIEVSIDQIEVEFLKEEQFLEKLNEECKRLEEESEENAKETTNENKMDTDLNETVQEANSRDMHLQEKREKNLQLIILQKTKVNYLKDMKVFVKQIESAIPMLSRLLFSKTQTDVLEVISFFVTCYEHGLTDMLFGIRKMLALVSYAEKTVKDAVTDAYKRLYLTPNSNTANGPVLIAKQLIKLTQDLTICERDALEDLVGEFAMSGELQNSVIKVLWEIFIAVDQSTQNKLYALIILGMIIKKIPEKGRLNIDVLINYGLSFNKGVSNEGENDDADSYVANDQDMLRASETCKALSYISIDANTKHLLQQDMNPKNKKAETSKKGKKSNKENESCLDSTSSNGKEDSSQGKLQFWNEPFKLLNTHQLFERLNEIIVGQFANFNTIYWVPMVENAMQCIFKLADNPIVIIENMINKLMEKMPPLKYLMNLASTSSRLPPVPLFNEESQSQTQSSLEPVANTQATGEDFTTNSSPLTRFVVFTGIVATKLLIFLSAYVVCELKRRKLCRENGVNSGEAALVRKNKDQSAKAKAKQRRMSIKLIRSFHQQPTTDDDTALEEEMGLHGAEAEDVEVMLIESVINTRVAASIKGHPSIIAQLLPLMVVILKDPAKYHDEQLQLACALSLVRLMLLSEKLCTTNLQLLFTLMEKSSIEKVRSQLILGVGDLVFRFPNALEPWTSHLYLPLRDTKSTSVRMNTIRVLSHLILKEMIKTRGQIYEIALCTIDKNSQISALSKLFFHELSQRNNGLVIYNAMPDIISQLSGGGGAQKSNEINENEDEENSNDGAPVDLHTPRVISEESFRTIVTYLFNFIKKDKQCETLIEKLCHAFRQAKTSERKCRDLVFCLSKIQLTESCIKKLKESFKWYSDKLIIPAVYETFKQTILKNARKLPNLKNETKMLIDELEKQIEEIKQKGINEDGGLTQANEGNNVDMESQDDPDEENEKEQPATNIKTTRQQTQKPGGSRRGATVETVRVNTSKSTARSKTTKSKATAIASKFAKKGKKIDSSDSSSSSSNENSSNNDSSNSD